MYLRRLVERAHLGLPLLDQALISAGNFASGVVAARALETPDFGAWVLANLLIWICIPIQGGLTIQPLIVNSAALEGEAFRRFLRTNLTLQVGFTLASSAVVTGLAAFWEPTRAVALPLGLATAALLGQDFARRVLYARNHMRAAVLSNLVNYDVQALLLAAAATQAGLTLSGALWIVAATSIAALAVGAWTLRRLVAGEGEPLGAVARQNLEIGKWTCAWEGTYVASTHVYPALVANLAGLEAAAGMGAILQLLGAVNLLTRPMHNYFLPRAARAYAQEGTSGLGRVLVQMTRLTAPPFILFLLVLVAAPALSLELMFGARFTQYAQVLQIFGLAWLLRFPQHLLDVTFQAVRRPRYSLYGQLCVAAIVYTAGVWLISSLGLGGAALATLLASAAQAVFLVGAALRWRRHERSGDISAHVAPLLPPGQYLVLKTKDGRRCYVPTRGRAVRLTASALFPAFRSSARAYRMLLRGWVAAGGALLTHSIAHQVCERWPLRDLLCAQLPELATVAALIGGGPEPKVTVQLMDRQGRVLAHAKYATTPQARAMLANEARLLSALPSGIAPRLISFLPFQDGDLLVQSTVPGKPYPPRRRLDTAQLRILNRLVQPGTSYRAADHPFIRRLADRADHLAPLVGGIVHRLGSREWPVVWLHGDFTFFNMHRSTDQCLPFDWEGGSSEGFPYLDAAHWTMLVLRTIDRRPPAEARPIVVAEIGALLPGEPESVGDAIADLCALYTLVTWYQGRVVDDYSSWVADFLGAGERPATAKVLPRRRVTVSAAS